MASPKNSSTSPDPVPDNNVLDAIHSFAPPSDGWRAIPGSGGSYTRDRDPGPEQSREGQRRFDRLCCNIKNQLEIGGVIWDMRHAPRGLQRHRHAPRLRVRVRTASRACAHRSSAAVRRATTDSGGLDPDPDPEPEPLSRHERGQA